MSIFEKMKLSITCSAVLSGLFAQGLGEISIEPEPKSSISFIVRDPSIAVIIIHSRLPRLSFESNNIIMKVENPQPGEFMIFVAPGTHILLVKADEYKSAQIMFNVSRKEILELKINVIKIPQAVLKNGTLDITVNPSGASLTFDGIEVAVEERYQFVRSAGYYRVQIEPGPYYVPIDTMIYIRPDTITVYNINLKKSSLDWTEKRELSRMLSFIPGAGYMVHGQYNKGLISGSCTLIGMSFFLILAKEYSTAFILGSAGTWLYHYNKINRLTKSEKPPIIKVPRYYRSKLNLISPPYFYIIGLSGIAFGAQKVSFLLIPRRMWGYGRPPDVWKFGIIINYHFTKPEDRFKTSIGIGWQPIDYARSDNFYQSTREVYSRYTIMEGYIISADIAWVGIGERIGVKIGLYTYLKKFIPKNSEIRYFMDKEEISKSQTVGVEFSKLKLGDEWNSPVFPHFGIDLYF